MSINGNYGGQESYAAADPNASSQPSSISGGVVTNGSTGVPVPTAPSAGNPTAGAAEGNNAVPKDEVGWYFVEQYYTTLSRNPEKLHLFYSKRSQFVSGVEAEKVSVSVGQRAINERIKELDIQDCKVRVSNVDSQESFKNIVVQVIGEMSNKAAPHRKFVQTFVLAEQPNGYFVLNDIFRYINEDEDEDVENGEPLEHQDTNAIMPSDEVKELPASTDSEEQQHNVDQVSKKPEEPIPVPETDIREQSAEPTATNGLNTPEEANLEIADDAPVGAVKSDEVDEPPESLDAIDTTQQEIVGDPDATSAVSPPGPIQNSPAQTDTPAAPSKPAAPKTWANLVAANRAAPAAVSNSTPSTSPATPQLKAAHKQSAPASAPQAPANEDGNNQTQQSQRSEWQTAGLDNAKKQSRQQSISGPGEKDNVLGYIKNVNDRVDASILKNTLLHYGKLHYFDVSRQKNCAFVEFADPSGYQAAVAANPHSIGGEQIYIEERRPRPTAYGGGFNARGGAVRGGRGGPENRPGNQGRGGFPKDGGRGAYGARGRGGNLTPRGRGQAQPA